MFLNTSQIQHGRFKKLICIGIWLASILFFPIPGVAFTLPKLLTLSFVAVLICLWLVLYADISPLVVLYKTKWLGALLFLFGASVLATTAFSSAPLLSLLGADPRIEGVLTYAVYTAVMLFALCTAAQEHGSRLLLRTILSINIAIVAYGVVQFVGVDPLSSAWDNQAFLHRIFSFLGHPNALGAFIVLTVPFIFLVAVQSEKPVRMFYVLQLALNGVVLMGTASRSSLLGIIVILLAFALLAPNALEQLRKMSAMHKGILIWIGLGIFVIGYVSFLHRFSLEGEQSRSLRSRAVIWSDTVEMISNNPWGYGLETMGTLYPAYKSKELLQTESLRTGVDRAHSQPLDLLLTVGPVGLAAFYGFLFFLLQAAIIFRREDPYLFAGGLGIFGYSTVLLFGFQTVTTAMLFWLIVGWMLGRIWIHNHKESHKFFFVHMHVIIAALCAVCLCTSIIFLHWTGQRTHLLRAEQYFMVGQLSNALGEFQEASALFSYDRTLLVRFIETALQAAEHAPDEASKRVFLHIAEQNIAQLRYVTNGNDGMIPLMSAWLAALQGDTSAVRSFVAQAQERMPTTIDTYRIASHSYRLIGDVVAVNKVEHQLKRLLPEYWRDREGKARLFWKANPWLQDLADEQDNKE